jgi:hypothetical protein
MLDKIRTRAVDEFEKLIEFSECQSRLNLKHPEHNFEQPPIF